MLCKKHIPNEFDASNKFQTGQTEATKEWWSCGTLQECPFQEHSTVKQVNLYQVIVSWLVWRTHQSLTSRDEVRFISLTSSFSWWEGAMNFWAQFDKHAENPIWAKLAHNSCYLTSLTLLTERTLCWEQFSSDTVPKNKPYYVRMALCLPISLSHQFSQSIIEDSFLIWCQNSKNSVMALKNISHLSQWQILSLLL